MSFYGIESPWDEEKREDERMMEKMYPSDEVDVDEILDRDKLIPEIESHCGLECAFTEDELEIFSTMWMRADRHSAEFFSGKSAGFFFGYKIALQREDADGHEEAIDDLQFLSDVANWRFS